MTRTDKAIAALRELLALHDIAGTAKSKDLLKALPLDRVEAAWREARAVVDAKD